MFVNTLTADDKYSLLNRDNLTQQNRTQLSQKQKAFSQFFLAFSRYTLNFEDFEKRDDPHSNLNDSTVTIFSDHFEGN